MEYVCKITVSNEHSVIFDSFRFQPVPFPSRSASVPFRFRHVPLPTHSVSITFLFRHVLVPSRSVSITFRSISFQPVFLRVFTYKFHFIIYTMINSIIFRSRHLLETESSLFYRKGIFSVTARAMPGKNLDINFK